MDGEVTSDAKRTHVVMRTGRERDFIAADGEAQNFFRHDAVVIHAADGSERLTYDGDAGDT